MIIKPNSIGLYGIDVLVSHKTKSSKIKGLIDTGSTECVCSYQIITSLKIRAVSFDKISTINSDDTAARWLCYEVKLGFNNKDRVIPLYRVNAMPQGIALILGMSFLSHCKFDFNGKDFNIDWLT